MDIYITLVNGDTRIEMTDPLAPGDVAETLAALNIADGTPADAYAIEVMLIRAKDLDSLADKAIDFDFNTRRSTDYDLEQHLEAFLEFMREAEDVYSERYNEIALAEIVPLLVNEAGYSPLAALQECSGHEQAHIYVNMDDYIKNYLHDVFWGITEALDDRYQQYFDWENLARDCLDEGHYIELAAGIEDLERNSFIVFN